MAARFSLASALLLVLALATALLSPSASAASRAWKVEAHDEGATFWFVISGDPACPGGRNPACALAPGDTVSVAFSNLGTQGHNFEVSFGGQKQSVVACCVDAGKNAAGTFTVPSGVGGESKYYCVPHQGLGMRGAIGVASAPTTTTAPPPASSTSSPGFEAAWAVVGVAAVALLASRK